MTKWLKSELKRANKEKKRCKKLYLDWKDDEFNCGPNKFIFGVISDDNKVLPNAPQTSIPSFQTLNCMQVYYNRDTEKYLLDIDLYNLESDDPIQYVNKLLKEFKDFVSNEYNIHINNLIEDNLFEYIGDMSNYWVSSDLATLYFRFYIFAQGYKQLCRTKKQQDKAFSKFCDELEKIGGNDSNDN